MKYRFPRSFYNTITFVGTALAMVSFGLILFLMLLEAMATDHKPYMGIIAFVILPMFLILGILMIIGGAWRQHRRIQSGRAGEFQFPHIDLNNARHLRAFTIFFFGSILFLMFSAFGSYKAYEYTDSDEFCGTTCHSVMEPEYTAYKHSPHARVGCAKCHIGPGAGWFVRSKLSGAYQVYATLTNRYPRPIPTPIKNLRPAQETCEQCHWPQHFFHEKQREMTYFLSDEQNTPWNLVMLVKIGGGNPESGITSGIHWHMNISNEVTYKAVDERRSIIPWVKVKSKDGKEHTYKNPETDVTEAQLNAIEPRRMDCIDCHNRPTHIYNHPARLLDHLMKWNHIDRTLPNLKAKGMELLDAKYDTRAAAQDGIRTGMEEYYKKEYPDTFKEKQAQIQQAIAEIQKAYSLNYFPEMKHDWRQYPDHIGHMYSPGCFRCHDGKHVNEEGQVLTRDCNVCHTLLAQTSPDQAQMQLSLTGVQWQHPVDIGDMWMEMSCSECHAPSTESSSE